MTTLEKRELRSLLERAEACTVPVISADEMALIDRTTRPREYCTQQIVIAPATVLRPYSRVDVLAARARRHETLWHPDDPMPTDAAMDNIGAPAIRSNNRGQTEDMQPIGLWDDEEEEGLARARAATIARAVATRTAATLARLGIQINQSVIDFAARPA